MKHILEALIDRGAFLVRDHRYGCGYTAAIVSSYSGEDIIGALTDDPGSLPFILQPALSQPYVPVFVAAGRTAEEAIARLDAKIAAMSEQERNAAIYLLSAIYESAEKARCYDDWYRHIDPDMTPMAWIERLKQDGYIYVPRRQSL